MSDFRYRNKNTGQVAEFPAENRRLEFLQNWETLTRDGKDTPEAAKYTPDGSPVDQFGAPRSSLLLGKPEPTPAEPVVQVGPQAPVDDWDKPEPKTEPAPDAPEQSEPESEPADEPPGGELKELPAKSAPKDRWVEVAMERGGLSRDEAEGMTKADLIDVFGD